MPAKPGDLEGPALLEPARAHEAHRRRGDPDPAARDRLARGHGLVRHVDHARAAATVDVRERGARRPGGRASDARVAHHRPPPGSSRAAAPRRPRRRRPPSDRPRSPRARSPGRGRRGRPSRPSAASSATKRPSRQRTRAGRWLVRPERFRTAEAEHDRQARARERACALHPTQAGPHEELERHLRRDGVAGQAEDERVAATAEDERLARPDRDTREERREADLLQGRLDEIVVSRRDPARDDEHVGAPGPRASAATIASVRSGATPSSSGSAPAARASAASAGPLLLRIRPGAGASSTATSSSPVTSSASLAAARRAAARSRRPRGRRPPPRRSRGPVPGRPRPPRPPSRGARCWRRARPPRGSRPRLRRAASSRPAARPSRPRGTGAPVITRSAWPASSGRSGHCPARSSPTTRSRTGASRTSSARSA